ncbi:MAG: ATP-binding protein [Thermodesulfobacteriota bacterium]
MSGRFKKLAASGVPKSLYAALNRHVGQALHGFDMIADGDRIAVGLSGGKDSFTLLSVLAERRTRLPISYEIVPIHVDLGFGDDAEDLLSEVCARMGFSLVSIRTTHGLTAHSEENRENPCFLCSRLRRKELFVLAGEKGCNKLALGHHKDDLIETLFLNMCYAGTISSMAPVKAFFSGALTVIRPLIFVDEDVTRRYARACGYVPPPSKCPTAGRSCRSEIKETLAALYGRNKKIKGNILRSMSRVNLDDLLIRKNAKLPQGESV